MCRGKIYGEIKVRYLTLFVMLVYKFVVTSEQADPTFCTAFSIASAAVRSCNALYQPEWMHNDLSWLRVPSINIDKAMAGGIYCASARRSLD